MFHLLPLPADVRAERTQASGSSSLRGLFSGPMPPAESSRSRTPLPAYAVTMPAAILRCNSTFQRRTDPPHRRDRRAAAFILDQRAEFPRRSGAMGHDGADVRLLRAASENQRGCVRGLFDLA